MIRDPVQRGVGKDEIEAAAVAGETLDDIGFERQPVEHWLAALCVEHLRRSIEPDRLARLEPLVKHARRTSGSAPEVDDPHPRRGPDHREQIVEWLLALAPELIVLRR